MKRELFPYILQDLKKKMVLIGGPRQCGKTYLAKEIMKSSPYKGKSSYLNWDFDDDRKAILAKNWNNGDSLIIFDELHKYLRWKRWLKGIYDKFGEKQTFLVTGSARLDTYRQGSDSMLGRYHYWRLHPFTMFEYPKNMVAKVALKRLMIHGGFPEPFLEANIRETKRWRMERLNLIFREDIRDLEKVQDLSLLRIFLDSLRERVSSTITISNIARDIEIAPLTAKKWLELLERVYLLFCIRPLTKKIPRSIKKPPKVYFYDNGDVITSHSGVIFENLVANHLLRYVHFREDYQGDECILSYIRDKENREVDFAVTINGKLEFLVEVKNKKSDISNSLKYYNLKLKPRFAFQVVYEIDRSFISQDGIEVMSPIDFFSKINTLQ